MPPHVQSLKESREMSDPESAPLSKGVEIPLLLQPLLGLDFLPPVQQKRSPPCNQISNVSDSTLETDPEEPLYLGEVLPKSQDPISGQALLAPQEEKKRRKSALGRLKSKVRKAKERRHQKRGRLGSHASAVSTSSLFDDSNHPSEPLDCLDIFSGDEAAIPVVPATAAVTDECAWIQQHQSKLEHFKDLLCKVSQESQAVSARVDEIRSRVSSVQGEIRQLELVLARNVESLQRDMESLEKAQNDLDGLEQERMQAERHVQNTTKALGHRTRILDTQDPLSSPPPQCLTPRDGLDSASAPQLEATPCDANTETPIPRVLRRTASSSFMRIHDLDLEVGVPDGSSTASSSISLDLPVHNSESLFYLDKDTKNVLEALARFGYDIVTDESDRFKPIRETERILSKRKNKSIPEDPSCPCHPWHHAVGKEILVWSGATEHDGFGCSVPLLKARGIIRTRARNVLELILDSSRVKEYNKMSLGRTDVVCLQQGVDTKADEGVLGLAGQVKITKSLNKPPFIRRNIELLSLMYARPEGGGFLLVSRSVWEDSAPNHNGSKDTLRSEMLLGANYLRPINGGEHCEITTITHVYSPSVPEMLAKSFAPTAAANFIRDLQALF